MGGTKFPAVKLTQAGVDMLASSQQKGVITYTKISIGDGKLADTDNILTFKALKNKKIDANITYFNDEGNGQFTLTVIISNNIVEEGFFARELGIYAKLDNGEEVLYAYTNAGDNADYLPDKTQPCDEIKVKITMCVSNAGEVKAIINSSIIFITLEECQKEIARHNTDAGAHADIRNNYVKKTGDTMTGNLTVPVIHGTADNAKESSHAVNADNATKATQDKNGADIAATYLPKSGGTMTGDIIWTGVNHVLNSNLNAGFFANDISTGIWDFKNSRAVLNYVQSANTINFGNASTVATFSGTVSAPTFSGHLVGNADTATNATNDGTGRNIADTYVSKKGTGASGTWGINITGNAGNANTVAGLAVHSGRNCESNKIVRTDGSGYIQCGYINSANGDEKNNSNCSYVWGTNGSDSYMRTYKTGNLCVDYSNHTGRVDNDNTSMRMHWSGQGGQPDWLWGGSNPSDMYVYNPRNFHVSYADSAGNSNQLGGSTLAQILAQINATNTGGIVAQSLGQNGYVKFAGGLIIQWGTILQPSITGAGRSMQFPISFSRRPTIQATIGQNTSSSDTAHLHTMPINTYANATGVIFHIYLDMSQDNYATIDWVAIGY